MDAFPFDDKDAAAALAGADIDLIMDDDELADEPLDLAATPGGASDPCLGADGSRSSWQDDAARILFASGDPLVVDANLAASIAAITDASFAATPTSVAGVHDFTLPAAPATPVKGEPRKSVGAFDWRAAGERADGGKSLRKLASSNISLAAAQSRGDGACAPASLLKLEPSSEPCAGEIPYSDLVFWLGDAATGEVECPCATCVYAERSRRSCRGVARRAGAGRVGASGGVGGSGAGSLRFSPYERMSAKIPVIAIPRIEGVN